MKSEIPARSLGDRVWIFRRKKNLTQQELAELCRLSYRVIGEIERGEKYPTMRDLARISQALGVNLEEMKT